MTLQGESLHSDFLLLLPEASYRFLFIIFRLIRHGTSIGKCDMGNCMYL
jgi:hypothetical protein